jgi:hypothetical protein
VRLCLRAEVTGVAFFDFQHGQTGVAPNGIELHPILGFPCLSGVVVNGSAPAAKSPGTKANVRLVSLTSPIGAGSDATLTVAVATGTTWTTPGGWPIDISCGAAGALHTAFLVT